MRLRRARLAGLVALAAAVAGCGSDADEGGGSVGREVTPEPSGTLRIAQADAIEALDPLLARNRAERLASRQVHEPLLSSQNGPFGDTRPRSGLVRSFISQEEDTIWTARLRGAVRFQNGEPLDADAVLANTDRWLSVSPGPELLPDLAFVDNPRPGLIRFILERPDPRFNRKLGDAHLGLVAPSALSGAGSSPVRLGLTGTGPFELREREQGRTLLARNADWWGTAVGLGPGVAGIELTEVADGAARVEELDAGKIEVADDLDPGLAARAARNPLLAVIKGGGEALGLERSVRGIDSARVDQSLSDVWLTDLP